MTKKFIYIKKEKHNLPFTINEIQFFYEEGLINLEFEDDEIILFEKELEKLQIIKRLRDDLGVNLEGIEVILHMRNKIIEMQKNFIDFIDEIKKEILEMKKPLKIKEPDNLMKNN